MYKVVGAGRVKVGHRSVVADSVQFIFASEGSVTIGDYCRIGDGVKFVVTSGDVVIGDWTTLHDSCLVLSTAGVDIGQHGWFGQNTVIDGSGGMTIGNGVRVGMYSQLWSHVAAGEQIEGCTLYGFRPVTISDNVWLVGSCIVASGVSLGERLVALIGSNITKSFAAGTVIAGSPASVKENLSFYRPIALPEKMDLLDRWLREFAADQQLAFSSAEGRIALRDGRDQILFVACENDARMEAGRDCSSTICCVENKTYTKRLTDLEYSVLRSLSSNKARFVHLPVGQN